ncbi:division/cell wall cluster transcriptional repressor MraZ [Pseudoalteromonas sp. SSM20]|jgi:MraZ protein|uniref:Transcriptional regulator MraZ n=1 Tax=Pseudoalteromonas spongiae TaxID=298657 RepID=A0ABU8ENB1_9GAMM|nr:MULTISPECIES: division/cell wall cluster transcriptional repressor MraZ [Pseudoalteromonas]MEC8325623.1 division/cell wall cluster transcriptional repressor MraZ [Pseudomonadota bacterium]ATC97592.1 MraZ protein [Pseudoalteromonas spongiae UST010723-006]KPV96801.1 Protein MraZ [Pseudoalteromonas sp. P1-9]MCF6458460.1 division/cell wall cluster transcriptional repressor MraZ [Pseudoalteromonas sp. MMG024]MDE3271207.1 division/cell wall cluster transcriptional repressor MraZ [Pseudoalteromona
MFRGAHAINLDDKGRLAIPTKFRALLQADCEGQLVCTIDLKDPCLLLYPLSEWQEVEQKLSQLSNMVEAERRVKRILLGSAMECQLDKNGRILLSSPLRAHAGLNKKLMLVGQLNKFELWDEDTWNEKLQQDIAQEQQKDLTVSERLQDFNF